MPLGDFPFGAPLTTYNSSTLNENEYDTYVANIATLQKHGTDGDAQLAVYSRYAEVHFVPDVFGDMVFNDVASDVIRQSTMTGTQFDTSYIVNDQHTLRGGFAVSGEQTNVTNVSTVMPVDATGAVTGRRSTSPTTTRCSAGTSATYVQDEWKLTNQLTLNPGLRFDQLYQFVDANQFSPRAALVYKPFDGTTFHAGYARYFTPPYQAQATQSNIALFDQHDQSAGRAVRRSGQARALALFRRRHRPDRAARPRYGDRRLLQDGEGHDRRRPVRPGGGPDAVQLGARLQRRRANSSSNTRTATSTPMRNFAYNITRAIDRGVEPVSLRHGDYNYLLNHYHYTDDMQRMTGSAGVSYRWDDTLFTRQHDLRQRAALPAICPTASCPIRCTPRPMRWSIPASRTTSNGRPTSSRLTVRFDVVNLFDQVYELRDGSGIGVFAPQYGARRGYYVGISQKL